MTILASTLNLPRLPNPPAEWNAAYQAAYDKELMTFFRQLVAPHAVNAASVNVNINSLPTQASLATLRSGDVYMDTTAAQVLKVKP
jgi:hypothetical protein